MNFTKEDVLNALKKEGITNLEHLAVAAAKSSNEEDSKRRWLITPGFAFTD